MTEDCQCKEEVEKEEAQALVAALEQSTGSQAKLPFVPGLSPEEDETLTIHVQQDVSWVLCTVRHHSNYALTRAHIDKLSISICLCCLLF